MTILPGSNFPLQNLKTTAFGVPSGRQISQLYVQQNLYFDKQCGKCCFNYVTKLLDCMV